VKEWQEFADGNYQRGDVSVAVPRCADPSTCEHDHRFYHGTELTVYLPHSCNEWVIGGVAEVEMMIEDLQAALRVLRGV
jgi:hypothetical protein